MNYDLFTEKQKQVIVKLSANFESKDQLEKWLSIPNKMFRDKPPLDLLLSGNFDYFDRLINNS